MSEHGWPDFHDDGAHHEDVHHEEPHQDDLHQGDLHHEDLQQHDEGFDHTPAAFEQDGGQHELDAGHHEPDAGEASPVHDAPSFEESHDSVEVHDTVVGHDPDAVPEPQVGEQVSTFPPILDVGPLPEPVDGFPWIDTGSLGVLDPATLHAAASGDVDPHELAEYAGAELPPGADPWATLAGSDDPATSALAKWWSENS